MRCAWAFALAAVAAGAACPGQEALRENPSDPAERGPYPVGAALGSVKVADGVLGWSRSLTVEIWYPAVPGSEDGRSRLTYDIRDHVPPRQRKKLIDAANVTSQACECFRELPVANGSFPVLLMIHGTASFRTASLHHQTHWASRGFVVVAADHPGIQLYDLLGIVDLIVPPRTNQAGDARGILAALKDASAIGFGILDGHLDLNRVGVAGHSAGGMALEGLGDVADVLVPMSGFAPRPGPRLKSTLVLSAQNDTIVNYGRDAEGYEACKASPKRFAAVAALGHLFCTDLCWIGAEAGGIVRIAEDHGIASARIAEALGENGCAYQNRAKGTSFLEPACGWQFVNYASSAAFEETLRCDAAKGGALRDIKSGIHVPGACPADLVYAYRESLGGSVLIV